MKKILLQVPSVHLSKNNVFKQDVNSQSEARIILKEDLKKLGYDFTTADNHSLNDCAWILYLDTLSLDGIYLQQDGVKARARALLGLKTPRPWPNRPLYQEAIKAGLQDRMALILWECKAVNPQNYNTEVWRKFKYIFTWDDDLVDNKKFFKFYHPFSHKASPKNIPPFNQKKLLVNMSGSKTSTEPNELYSARLKTIEYFTNKYPNDFDLYGGPWNVPRNRMQRTFPWLVKKYKSNRGESMDKIETLSKYKFTVCYENMEKVKGWVTEKIFDALTARSVPIYWGAENIEEFVDADTFIDRRKFKNNEELANYLFSVTEEKYNEYLTAGERYLQSEKFKKFLPENFSKTIIETLGIK